ncbi:MAG: uroporphyrinogen decarboxylase [Candidatus Omnitrophica bacterium]|nr:uroporphyrinogen decarboxylase [Candidatus Omnitrophota bacterium]
MTQTLKLENLRVVTFENRMAESMCQLIQKNGGIPISAPSMQEIPWEKNPDVFSFAEKLFQGEIDIVIFLTGVGTRFLMEALASKYKREQIIDALKKVIVVARGPKPVKALRELGIPIAVTVPEPNTWRDILTALDESEKGISLDSRTVAIQEYGKPNSLLEEGLRERGARVIRVPIYRWTLPDDTQPLQKAIQAIVAGSVDIALFTSAAQVDHLFRMANEMGVEHELKKAFRKLVVASIGPVCSEAIVAYGIQVDLEPTHNKMGHLVLEVAEKAGLILANKRERNISISHSLKGDRYELQCLSPFVKVTPELEQSVFLKACRLEKTPYTPVWLMRQAGRYMKEYRDIRDKTPFLDLCKNSDLAAQVTVTAQEKIGADAAIIFSDILLIAEPFGLALEYSKDDGPVLGNTIRNKVHVDQLPEIEPKESLPFVFEAIQKTRTLLKKNIPLIGFSGAPFTLASYMIEGGSSKNFQRTKALMYADEGLWRALMEKIARGVAKYLEAQIKAGAQAIQLFDSWVGCLGIHDYERYVLPYSKQVLDNLQGKVPVIHFGTNTGSFLESMSRAGGEVVGVDFRIPLDLAWQKIGFDKAIQGNLDPVVLYSDLKTIRERVKAILSQAKNRPGHIFNLGHGVLPETPVENVIALGDMVHEMSARG